MLTLPAGSPAAGVWTFSDLDETSLVAGLAYVDVHSSTFPLGEIRGQIIDLCGNGTLEGTEECDDGATSSGDGCDATCNTEPCTACVGEPSVCTPINTCADANGCCPVFCTPGNDDDCGAPTLAVPVLGPPGALVLVAGLVLAMIASVLWRRAR